ncbi:MAG: retron St85 family effector protein [archaeon]
MISNISKKIVNNILPKLNSGNLTSVFLVGADLSKKASMRKKIYEKLKLKRNITIYLPETLMKEVFNSHQVDFLTLENLLAENVNCVVMCIESPGSIAEFGAFTNHNQLRDKLLVIVNKKYKNNRSFINLGPLKMLTRRQKLWYDYPKKKERLIKHKLSDSFLKNLNDKIKRIKKQHKLKDKLTNPIKNERFLLSILYCLGSLSNKEMIYIIKDIIKEETEPYIIMSKAILSSLSWQRIISLNNNRYYLTEKGLERFKKLFRFNYLDTMKILDNYRIEILNEKLR